LGYGQDARDAIYAGADRAGQHVGTARDRDWEISVRRGHTYRIVVSDLVGKRPIWFGGAGRPEASMAQFDTWLGAKKCNKTGLVVMYMLKPFRDVAADYVP